jgi:hypothetical protein
MFAGYMWLSDGGSWGSYTVRWDRPRSSVFDASLHYVRTPPGQLVDAKAWVRSVTVRDPLTGKETVKDSQTSVPVRIEDNAVAVTFSLNASFNTDAEALVHAWFWS